MRKLFIVLLVLSVSFSAVAQVVVQRPATANRRAAATNDTTIQFMPSTVGPYAPKKLLGGDREFDGHGPEIRAWIQLKIVSNKYIDAVLYMHARETTADWSETEGTWTKRLYTAPAGHQIKEILSGKYSEVHYVSRPGVNAFSPRGLAQALGSTRGADAPFKDDGLVTRWNIVGDTGGGDISDDDNPHDDTQVAVQLNPVKLKLSKPIPVSKLKTPPTRMNREKK